jgi:mRNA-degrading endonuclease RelE of RelBE toxin-antitoxin system
MKRLYSSLIEFLKPKIRPGSILRGIGVLAFSMGTATGVIYTNYLGYWKGTIYRTQTVDFNILANLLPGKVSIQLSNQDTKGLQKTLDSNYGLFGIIITDCKSTEISCPTQKIIYASKAKIKKIDDYRRILVSQDNYTKTWLRKFDNVDSPEEKLGSELFIPLYNPPSSEQTWEFTTPRETEIVYTRQKNQGKVIGRIYLLRANPPLFTEELRQWLQNPLSTSSKTLVYNAIAITALFTGLFVWLLSELIYHLKLETEKRLRIFAENESRILKEKIEAEEAVRRAETDLYIAAENELKAVNEKLEADKVARFAQLQLTEIEERIKKEKHEVESKLHAVVEENEKLFFEKLEFEVKLDKSSEELERITKQKNEAEDAARKAQEKSEQATEEKLKAESLAKRTLDQQLKYQEKLESPTASSLKASNWLLGFSSEFKSHIDRVDRKMQGRILKAISEITEAPMTIKGDTIKPLTKEKRFVGHWRYRIGDYRLIYHPDMSTSTIKFMSFEARGGL